METSKKTRTRLAPEARIATILDHTATIVASEGVAAVTMEKVGNAAGISKSLVYSYFPSITDLLKKLLNRELKALRRRQMKASDGAETFEQLVRAVTREYLHHIEERGILIYRLQSEPSVSKGGGVTDYTRDVAVQHLAEIVHRVFEIPMSIAVPATDISFGLPDAAGIYLDRKKADRQVVEDITVAMIIGCVKALKDSYDVSFKPIR
jgi:TetR/AcrR family transcriptional regulator, fatty acid biosynthesis regulator